MYNLCLEAPNKDYVKIFVGVLIILLVNVQLNVRKCNECGQPLPESYEPPANEPWTTGIFGCAEDTESCKLTDHFWVCELTSGIAIWNPSCNFSGTYDNHHFVLLEIFV